MTTLDTIISYFNCSHGETLASRSTIPLVLPSPPTQSVLAGARPERRAESMYKRPQ
jgi:hypothetical protein